MRSARSEFSTTEHRMPPDNDPDRSLWTYYELVQDEGSDEPARVLASVWVPTLEERDAIAAGANIRLLMWARRTPPVAMDVTTEKIIGPNL